MLLGFGGVLVGAVIREQSAGWDTLLAVLAAGGAVVYATMAIAPRVADGIAPSNLLDRYADKPVADTMATVAATMGLIFERQEQRIGLKSRRLTTAAVLLLASVTFLVAGLVWRSPEPGDLWSDVVESPALLGARSWVTEVLD